ncbi:MAG: hypothetical protein QOG97_818, partial [Acidimicrobiaceae bacterium]|nr:hypothetical protein [Acidimicrobiaceae bacterium]
MTYDMPVRPDAAVDIGLLRDWGEWQAVARAVEDADPGGMVLVDGDLEPDWRLPPSYLDVLFARAAGRSVTLAGVTKHSSLARGGAPLLGQLERQAEEMLGPRAMWWAQLATTRPDSGPERQILAARLDPDARFSFRVDVPAGADPESILGSLSALADDAAFPGERGRPPRRLSGLGARRRLGSARGRPRPGRGCRSTCANGRLPIATC